MDITVTPNPVSVGGSYHVTFQSNHLKGGAEVVVDTTGPDDTVTGLPFYNRTSYTADANGNVAYDTSMPSTAATGNYLITAQTPQGGKLDVLGSVEFPVA